MEIHLLTINYTSWILTITLVLIPLIYHCFFSAKKLNGSKIKTANDLLSNNPDYKNLREEIAIALLFNRTFNRATIDFFKKFNFSYAERLRFSKHLYLTVNKKEKICFRHGSYVYWSNFLMLIMAVTFATASYILLKLAILHTPFFGFHTANLPHNKAVAFYFCLTLVWFIAIISILNTLFIMSFFIEIYKTMNYWKIIDPGLKDESTHPHTITYLVKRFIKNFKKKRLL